MDPFVRAAALITEQTDPGAEFRNAWRAKAREGQIPPDGDWRTWYVRGGRGGGKTWAAAHTLAEWILADPEPGEWGIVAPTYQLAWSVCVEGESGLLAALGTTVREVRDKQSKLVEHWHRSFAQIKLRNGHVVWVASAQDGGVGIQGKNLRAAWCDEIGMWDQWELTWNESLMYAVRKGTSRIIATGTPKKARRARKLVKLLLDDPAVPVSALRTLDNAANLSPAFLAEVVGKAKGTRLERQELEGILLADVEGALWTPEIIDAYRAPAPAELLRVVVAVDPAVSNEEGSDETGIVVVGEAEGGHGFVLGDYSMRGSPDECMRKAVWAYQFHQADRIVAEANNGGDYIGTLLHTVDPMVPFRKVVATRGKRVRAEPVSALYEQGRIHHTAVFGDLEEQMVSWVPSDPGDSPDRVDALCLIAGTPVLTARGEIPIDAVVAGDLAWTRQGWKPVTAAGLTRRGAEVMTVQLSSGRTLAGTRDHPVWVDGKGFTRIDALVWGDILSGWKNPRSASFTEASATSATPTPPSVRTASTTAPPAAAGMTRCTATSGATAIPARRSPRAGTSTTMTTTRSTTTLPISSCAPPRAMLRSILRSLASLSNGLLLSGPWLLSGIAATKGGRGTASTASASGKAGCRNAAPARSAAKSSMPGSPVAAGTAHGPASTGLPSAGFQRQRSAQYAAPSSSRIARADPQPVPVHVVSCSAAGRADVYDLTVADAHEFVASGVVVHNCWAVHELSGLSAGSWLAAYGTKRCEECEGVYAEAQAACPRCHPDEARKPAKTPEAAPQPQPLSGWAAAYGVAKCPQGHSYVSRRHNECPHCKPGASRPGSGFQMPRFGGMGRR